MTDLRAKRPRTLWLGRDSSTRAEESRSSTKLNTEETPKPNPATNNRDGITQFNCYEENPWSVYEPRAKICRKQPITLAQHRKHRQNVVNIRCLPIDRPQVQGLLETIRRLSHPIFPRLLESYYHTGELHLIWEPVEITVNYILTARWPINETELAYILRSTLDGIKFLRDQGRALAILEAETILLDRRGHVRLAGVEQSYQISASDMNAETLKMTALATITRSLIATGAAQGIWSSKVRAFLENLTTKSLDELMQDTFLETATDERDLKLCEAYSLTITAASEMHRDTRIQHLTPRNGLHQFLLKSALAPNDNSVTNCFIHQLYQ
ncbi:hypothetical protein BDQ94DRAFT_164066 [Aspergillus welwitschiae]|uniref:Uncharacterized protein n=1 Tax=Aspergillus welwitschiae TaxID=1341132 RepID=A0A3F3PJQ1_9EURO|nr:hypothetical protein BDQ94DRAFT_164066 [Aspergillus welwitschiae]RDH26952.1 hypothetical protein BDQ94DRAFT_164066 [Aspergillus welwitschiae]